MYICIKIEDIKLISIPHNGNNVQQQLLYTITIKYQIQMILILLGL